jgi:hypothetical protein
MQQLWLGFFGRGAAQAYEATFGDGRKPDGEQARRRSLTRCRARGWALAQAGAHPMRRRGVWTRAYAAFGGRKNGKTMKPSVVRWTSAARAPAQRRACSSDTALHRDHSAEVTSRWVLAEAANRGLHRTKRRDRRAGVALLVVDGQIADPPRRRPL